MEPLKARAAALKSQIDDSAARLKLFEQEKYHEQLLQEITKPDFWQANPNAQRLAQEEGNLAQKLQPWRNLVDAADELADLARVDDGSMTAELQKQADKIEQQFDSLKKDLRFSGPYDDHSVVLNIYAGAGGTDAQDWAQMLERMYLRWADSHGFKTQIVDESPGETAGIKSATLEITGGINLYGKLAGEHGVHRLVRRSPFNSAGSRETSFAKVDVLPLIDKPGEINIDDKDLKVDVFRAGGHGGQSVNTTDSAVRLTHLPTGITVAIQNERSQLQNKETALNILRSRLAQLQLEQHAETLADIKGPSGSNEFGSQIRNYILDDRILKDLRTSYGNHDPQKTLDGDLDPLIDAWLEHKH